MRGSCRKKGKLENASKKHLWDRLRQEMKVLDKDFKALKWHGIPVRYKAGAAWVSGGYYFALWAAEGVIKSCTRMEKLVLELERRME